MDDKEKEALKGKLLDSWLTDLSQDRAPRSMPETRWLSQQDVEEVLELARWMKATFFRFEPSPINADRVAARVRDRVQHEIIEEQRNIEQLLREVGDFAILLQRAREQRGIDPRTLERVVTISTGTISELESGSLPPHRVPIEAMLRILKALHITSKRVMALIRIASTTWAEEAYRSPQSELGRIDPHVSAHERRQLLEEGWQEDMEQSLTRERAQIEQFCQELTRRLS